jgi:hypothetical protein
MTPSHPVEDPLYPLHRESAIGTSARTFWGIGSAVRPAALSELSPQVPDGVWLCAGPCFVNGSVLHFAERDVLTRAANSGVLGVGM